MYINIIDLRNNLLDYTIIIYALKSNKKLNLSY